MRSIQSVVREKDPHEDREEQCGDYAKQRAERACQPKGCDERPNEAGQYYANFQRRYWLGPLDPRQPADRTRLLAKPGQCSAASACWTDQARLAAAMPTPTKRPPPRPRRAWLALASHQACEQTTGFGAKPGGSVSRASGFAPAREPWQRALARPTGPAELQSRLDVVYC